MYDVASAADAAVYGLGRSATTNADSLWLMTAGGWRAVSAIPASSQGCDATKATADLAVAKAGEVWVVGTGRAANSTQSCIMAQRWNGSAWQSFAPPAIAGASLEAVSVRAGNDVWAVGDTITHDQQSGVDFEASLVLHWNGTTWAAVPFANSGFLRDVEATRGGVWAVGTALIGSGFPVGMLMLKWDGKTMQRQSVQALRIPGTIDDDSNLLGVSVRGGVVTSVGNYMPNFNVIATLTERRNAS